MLLFLKSPTPDSSSEWPRQLVPQAPHSECLSQISGLLHVVYYFLRKWDLTWKMIIITVMLIFLICTALYCLQSVFSVHYVM